MWNKIKWYLEDRYMDLRVMLNNALDDAYEFWGERQTVWRTLLKWLALGLVLGAIVGISASYAHATSPSKPAPSYSQGQGQEQGQSQANQANAQANGGGASSNGTVTSSSNDRSLGLGLPRPVSAQHLPAAGSVCALSSGDASAFGWNFVSSSSAKQVIDGLCVAEMQATALEQQCKYRTATAIRVWIAQQATASRELAAVEVTQYHGEVMQGGVLVPQRTTSLASALGEFLRDAGADRPWESERNFDAAQCVTLRNPVIEGPRGPAGPAGPRGPRGYRGKAGEEVLVPVVPCAVCKQ